MKKINFVRTISRAQQHQIKRWYWHMALLASLTLLTIIIVQTKQLIDLSSIKETHRTLSAKAKTSSEFAQRQQTLRKEKELVVDHLQTIKQWALQKDPGTEIVELVTAIKNSGSLLSCSRMPKKIEMTVALNDPTAVTAIMHSIKTLPFIHEVKLSSLTQHSNRTEVKLNALTK